MSADNALTTRVSDETAAKFHEQREEMGLSANQFLKFLVLAAQDKLDEFDEDLTHLAIVEDDEVRVALIKWMRGK